MDAGGQLLKVGPQSSDLIPLRRELPQLSRQDFGGGPQLFHRWGRPCQFLNPSGQPPDPLELLPDGLEGAGRGFHPPGGVLELLGLEDDGLKRFCALANLLVGSRGAGGAFLQLLGVQAQMGD